MELIRATIIDLNTIYKLEQDNFSDYYSLKQIEEDLKNDRQFYIYLSMVEDQIVGYVYYSIVLDEAELMRIAILDQYRGRGYGKELILASIKMLRGKISKIFLEVSKNNSNALRLYHNVGFQNISIRERYYKDGFDAIVMKLELFDYNAE